MNRPLDLRLFGTRALRAALCVIAWIGNCGATPDGFAQDMPDATANSFLYQALQEYNARPTFRDFTAVDPLTEYARQCREATGISLPDFTCGQGVEVPGQGNTPATGPCDNPNSLNRACDPGSRFQVLSGRTGDAVAVAHCRKVGNAIAGSTYGDIAIIQYNKKNGAVCFYQALGALPGDNIPSPESGSDALWADGATHWDSPAATHGIGCTSCHDNGGFIRSNYIAQLRTPPNAMPNQADGYSNFSSPLRYVGKDYQNDHSWSIEVANAPGDSGPSCSACHRIAVNDVQGHGDLGTGLDFALRATASTQPNKNPHSPTSPIWMRPGQIFYDPAAEATAKRFHDCAVGFKQSRYTTAPAGCVIKPLGMPWIAPVVAPHLSSVAAIEYYLNK